VFLFLKPIKRQSSLGGSPEQQSDEPSVADSMAKIRALVVGALQDAERLEEICQGQNKQASTQLFNNVFGSFVKHLSLLDEQGEQLDPDFLAIPSDILASLTSQSSASCEILQKVKEDIDSATVKAANQVQPFKDLQRKMKELKQMDDSEFAEKYKTSVEQRQLILPDF
jgi:hypothetical protein